MKTIRNNYDDLSFSALKKEIQTYTLEKLRSDSTAALVVALLSVPISMAYALAAGLPPSVGIFATIFGTIFASAFGSSKHLIVGPTNMIAILIQAGISEILFTYYRDVDPAQREVLATHILIQLTFVVGILQLLAGIFKLGRLTQFVSRSVVLGYVCGTAITLMVTQLFYFLGIKSPDQPFSLYEKASLLATHLSHIHWPTAVIGVGSLLIFLICEKTNRKFPAAIVILVIASLAVAFFDLSPAAIEEAPPRFVGEQVDKVVLVRDFGQMHTLIPHLSSPFFDLRIMNTLLSIAFAIALLSVLEAVSISRSIATHTGQILSINQEIFGLGVANSLSSLLGAMPSSGSFARSSLNYSSGARTRLSGIFCGLFVAAILFAFRPIVLHIPLAALAALLVVSATRMVNFKEVALCIKATGSDALVFGATTLSCVLFNVDIAFYIGVMLSIVFYLRKAAIPHLVECSVDEHGDLKVVLSDEESASKPIRIIHVEGELFFGAADLFQKTVRAVAQDPSVKVIVLHLTNAHHIDATSCVALQQLYRYLQRSGRYLIASGLTRQVWQVLCHSGLINEIGHDNLFLVNEQEPAASTKHALKRAEHVLILAESS